MRKRLYIGAGIIGWLFMVIGIASTYVAFGQDETESSQAQEVVVEVSATFTPTMTPTLTLTPTMTVTPIVEAVVIESQPAVEQASPMDNTQNVSVDAPSAPVIVEVIPSPEPVIIETAAESSSAPVVVEEAPVIEAPAQELNSVVVEETAIPLATPTDLQLEAQPAVVEAGATEVVTAAAAETIPAEPVTETTQELMSPDIQTEAELPPVANNSAPNLSSPVVETVPEAAPVDPQNQAESPTTAVIEETPVEAVPSVEPTAVPANTITQTVPEAAPTDNQVPVETPVVVVEATPLDLAPTSAVEIAATEMIPDEIVPTLEVVVTETAVAETQTPEMEQATAGGVFGQVASFLGSSVEINLSLVLVEDGSRFDMIAGDAGSFLFENLGPGDYILEASAYGYLSQQAYFTLSEGQQLELPAAQLYAGDLDNDNEINLSDLVLIAANYNGPALISEADLNGDGWIDISDLTIVGAQFGMVGPLPWGPQS